MNGNVTKEGIKLDFEWMKRVGIGGVHNFDAVGASAVDPLPVVEQPLISMPSAWRPSFRSRVELASEAVFEFAIASSPGYSESGGPWVKPHEAMKKFVWSETRIEGGKRFNASLSKPPDVPGPFQNISLVELDSDKKVDSKPKSYYADVAVVACRVPTCELLDEKLESVIKFIAVTRSSSGNDFFVMQR